MYNEFELARLDDIARFATSPALVNAMVEFSCDLESDHPCRVAI